MEEEFIQNQERLKPQEEKHEACWRSYFLFVLFLHMPLGFVFEKLRGSFREREGEGEGEGE